MTFDRSLGTLGSMTSRPRQPTKVPKGLRAKATELFEEARLLKGLVDCDVWWGRPETLENVEKRISKALKAIRYRRTRADLASNLLTMIESAARSVTRDDCRMTLKQAVKLYTEYVQGMVSEFGLVAEITPNVVQKAIEAYSRPARGRPENGQMSREAAFGALLLCAGLVGEDLSADALRKYIQRLRK